MIAKINKTLFAAILLRTMIFAIIAFLYTKYMGLVETLAGLIGVGETIVHYGPDGPYTTSMNGVSESGWLAMFYYFITALMIPALIISLISTRGGKPLGKLIKPAERDSITQQEYWHTMTFLYFIIALAAAALSFLINIFAFRAPGLLRFQMDAIQAALIQTSIISALFSIARASRNKNSVILTLLTCFAALGAHYAQTPIALFPSNILYNTWLYIGVAFAIVIALRAFSKYPLRFNYGAAFIAVVLLLSWILRGNYSLDYLISAIIYGGSFLPISIIIAYIRLENTRHERGIEALTKFGR